MTDQQLLIRHRKVIIQARLNQSLKVKQICEKYQISSTAFYKWLNRYLDSGDVGLANKIRSNGKQPRQISAEVERAILNYSYQYPAYGPQRITLELQRTGIHVGKTAVYNALKRNGLNYRKYRYQRLQAPKIMIQTAYQRDRELSRKRSLKTKAPGYLVNMDTFYVGTIKGIGRIYQMTAIDTFSNYAWARVYSAKSAKNACDFLLHVRNNSQGRKISRILTDNGLEFTTHHVSNNHKFESLLKFYRIKHKYTKVRHPWTNGAVERLNQTLYHEFYQVVFRKKIYETLQELQEDLDHFIDSYNFKRPNQGKRNKGKVPGEIYLLHNYF
jgi:transposase InsO family protein